MAYSETLAVRIRTALTGNAEVTEKRMFGGIAFLLGGRMCCGVNGERLLLRLGEPWAAEALAQPHVRPMDFTGKPLRGYVFVDPPGAADAEALQIWVDMAVAFTESVPKKK